MIGIVVAMSEEIELLLEKINKKDYKKIEEVYTYYTFTLEDKNIVAVVSGVGKIRASAATQFMISTFNISRVFNFGMAGGIDSIIAIGEMINVEKCFDYDEDLSAFDQGKVERTLELINDQALKKGINVSGDKFINDAVEARKINEAYNALTYEMELSAIALVCNMHHIPIYSLKYVSDKADENADIDFYESLSNASKRFGEILINVLHNL